MAAAQDVAVCAPLEGAARSQCINSQLSSAVRPQLRPSPAPVPPLNYSTTDPALRLPSDQGSLADQAVGGLDAARQNSDLRSNLLQQQIRRDLSTGPGAAPPMRPVAPMAIRP